MASTITNKTNGITISGGGINTSQNTIVYTMTIPLTAIGYAVETFPYVNGVAQLQGSNFIYGENKHIPNLPDILASNLVEQSDVGLTGKQVIDNFSTSILWVTNALGLVVEDWDFVE